jgi:hypothetical protein
MGKDKKLELASPLKIHTVEDTNSPVLFRVPKERCNNLGFLVLWILSCAATASISGYAYYFGDFSRSNELIQSDLSS